MTTKSIDVSSLTLEEFKKSTITIKARIRKELIKSGQFSSKKKQFKYRKNGKTYEVDLKAFNGFSKEKFNNSLDRMFVCAAVGLGVDESDVRIKFNEEYYYLRLFFYTIRHESDEEIKIRLENAVTREYNKIKSTFTAIERKNKIAARKEAKKRKENIKRAKLLIQDLGEDVYEVFEGLIKNPTK